MTLGGLALAIGILVDETTVTIENIHTHLEMGKTKPSCYCRRLLEIRFTQIIDTALHISKPPVPALSSGIPAAMFLPLSLAVGFAMIYLSFYLKPLYPL